MSTEDAYTSLPFSPEAAFFIHSGVIPSYLFCSLFQAHSISPGLRIALISSQDPRLGFVEHIPLDTLTDSWKPMADAYIHLSTNPEPFERFCFYRWFALRAAMHQLGLKQVIHLDSDVMLYFDPLNEPIDVEEKSIAYGSTCSYSGHFAWIGSLKAIDAVCQTMLDLFLTPKGLAELQAHFERQSPYGGGVCDMYALGWIVWNQVIRFCELNRIRSGCIFDQGLGDSRIAGKIEKWRMQGGRKVLHWSNRIPFFETTEGELVRAMTIHFQGPHKILMYGSLSSSPIRFRIRYNFRKLSELVDQSLDRLGVLFRHVKGGVRKRIGRLFNFASAGSSH